MLNGTKRLTAFWGFTLLGLSLGTTSVDAQQYGGGSYSQKLGISYQFVRNGAQLTTNPSAGSPLNGLRLERGDTITALDGYAVRGAADLENHYGQTTVTLIDVRTGITKQGTVTLAGSADAGGVKLKWKCNAYGSLHDQISECSDPSKGGQWITSGTSNPTPPPLNAYQVPPAFQPYQNGLDRSGQRRNTDQPYPGGTNFRAIPYDRNGSPIYGYSNGYNRYDSQTGQPVTVPARPQNAPPNYYITPGR